MLGSTCPGVKEGRDDAGLGAFGFASVPVDGLLFNDPATDAPPAPEATFASAAEFPFAEPDGFLLLAVAAPSDGRNPLEDADTSFSGFSGVHPNGKRHAPTSAMAKRLRAFMGWRTNLDCKGSPNAPAKRDAQR
jgi:hypothetical protein